MADFSARRFLWLLAQIRIARAKGLEMPRLQTLYALLKMAAIRRKEDQASTGGSAQAKL